MNFSQNYLSIDIPSNFSTSFFIAYGHWFSAVLLTQPVLGDCPNQVINSFSKVWKKEKK